MGIRLPVYRTETVKVISPEDSAVDHEATGINTLLACLRCDSLDAIAPERLTLKAGEAPTEIEVGALNERQLLMVESFDDAADGQYLAARMALAGWRGDEWTPAYVIERGQRMVSEAVDLETGVPAKGSILQLPKTTVRFVGMVAMLISSLDEKKRSSSISASDRASGASGPAASSTSAATAADASAPVTLAPVADATSQRGAR